MPIASSWYQCPVQAQLDLMPPLMEFVLLCWLLGHSNNFINSDQREERTFLLLVKAEASSLLLPGRLYPLLLQAWCLSAPSSLYHAAWALSSANTL